MKVIILAGGFGTRFGKMTATQPKPMIKIGGVPILLHIIKYFKSFGLNEFYIALGYKGNIIKKYFKNYKDNEINLHLVDTGLNTMTGGRLKKLRKYLNSETFILTYGDGLCNVNIKKLIKFHKNHRKIATVTAVHPPGRFGTLEIKNKSVFSFNEKHQLAESWINGGFFVLNKEIFNFLKNDRTILELEPMKVLSKRKQLMAYKHSGFWQCMDTLREKNFLEEEWKKKPKWKKWK